MLKLIILIFHTALRVLFIYTGEALAWFLGKQQARFNLLNIILLILGIITIFIYVKIFNIYEFIIVLTSGLVSYGIIDFFMDGFKLSENKYIRYIQIFTIFIITIILVVFALYYLDIDFMGEIHCQGEEGISNTDDKSESIIIEGKRTVKTGQKVVEGVVDESLLESAIAAGGKLIDRALPYLGGAGAAGAVWSQIVKVSTTLTPGQRAAVGALTAGVTATVVTAGCVVGGSIGKKASVTSLIDTSVKSVVTGETPSPTTDFISSVIENIENIDDPLVTILENLFTIDVMELILILLIVFLWLTKNVSKYNIKLFYNIINKYLYKNNSNADLRSAQLENLKNKYISYNENFSIYLIIVITIILILIKIFTIYVHYEIYSDIDNYIKVYNFLKKSSIFILISNQNILSFKLFGYRHLTTENKSVDSLLVKGGPLNIRSTDDYIKLDIEKKKYKIFLLF